MANEFNGVYANLEERPQQTQALKNISNSLDKSIIDVEAFLRREIEKRDGV